MAIGRKATIALIALLAAISAMVFTESLFAETPRYGGVLRIGVRLQQESHIDPRYPQTIPQIPGAEMVFDRLFTWGENGFESLVPGLALSYQTKDSKVWTIKLRKGVKFHNGREMTAEDVKANFDWRITTPKGWQPLKYKEQIKGLKKVDVVDRYTVRITLDKPFSSLLRVLAWALRGIIPPEEVEKWGDQFALHACGTGPFKVVEVKPNEKYVLERFDGYWGPKPYIDRVELIYYRSDESRLIALEKGEIDFAQLYDEAKPSLSNNPNLAYQEALDTSINQKHIFNLRRWPGSDIRFRKAVWMGADWKNIAVNAYAFKSGKQARTFLEHSPYFNPEAVKLVPPYNPEEAKRLIQAVEKDAGKKIPPIVWIDQSASPYQNLGEMAKSQLGQIGVPLNVQLLSPALWSDKITRDPKIDWDTGGYGVGFAIDPSIGFTLFETDSGIGADGKSLGGYSNPEFDQWMVKSAHARNEKDRIKSFHAMEKIIINDAAAIPMWPARYVYAWSKKLQGVRLNSACGINVTTPWANMWLVQ